MIERVVICYQEDEFKSLIKDCITEILFSQPQVQSAELAEKKILTRQEAAKLLHISLPTLNNYSKMGLIKAYRLGHKVCYKLEDIQLSLIQIKTLK